MIELGISWVQTRCPRWLLLAALCGVCAVFGLYRGLYRESPVQVRHDALAAVELQPRSVAELDAVLGVSTDSWTEHVSPNGPIVVVLDRVGMAWVEAMGIPHAVIVEDIQAVADAERSRLAHRTLGLAAEDWFSEYRDVQEISDYLDVLGERWPDIASLRRLGTSVDGRPIRGVDISRGGDIHIVLNGGQHAREWIAVMVPMCIADKLLTDADSDPRVSRILDAVTFHVVPLVNPDGYLHSWNVDRYWRKNRRGGHGVDLNRNYSVAWGQRGSSSNKRSEVYRGPHAFSEPETQAMWRLFNSENIAAHIDFHSFSQLILYPWAYQRAPAPDRDRFAAIADRMSTAIYVTHGKEYKIQSGAELYPASGTFTDWAYGEAGAVSFIIELRPKRRGGFVLPPEEIKPTCEESYAATLELAEWMMRSGRRGSSRAMVARSGGMVIAPACLK